MGQFKLRYPQVHSMGDVGELLLGGIGREVLYVGQLLLTIFLCASHVLTFTVTMNTLTEHGTCTIVFGVVGMILSFLCNLPRTMDKVYLMAIVCKEILLCDPSRTPADTPSSLHQHCGGHPRDYDLYRCPGAAGRDP